MFKINIDAVSGEHFYSMAAREPRELLPFLERYDHEGSTVLLQCYPGPRRLDTSSIVEVSDPERIYRILKGEESL